MKKLSFCLYLLFLAQASFGMPSSTISKKIVIGILCSSERPRTRTPDRFGVEIIGGVQAGVKYTANGLPQFEFRMLDIGSTLANIPGVIERAYADGIQFFIGLGLSDEVHVAMPVLESKNLLLFTPTASDDDIVKPGGRVFMMFPRLSLVAQKLVETVWAAKIRDVAIINAKNFTHSVQISKKFVDYFNKAGGRVSKIIDVRPGNIDFKALTGQLQGTFSHVFLPLMELDAAEIVTFLSARKSLFPHIKGFIGTNAWGNYFEVMKSYAGTNVNAIVPVVYDWQLKTAENTFFVTNFDRQMKVNLSHLGAFSFDAVLLLKKMLITCGKEKLIKTPAVCLSESMPINLSTGIVTTSYLLNLHREITIVELNK